MVEVGAIVFNSTVSTVRNMGGKQGEWMDKKGIDPAIDQNILTPKFCPVNIVFPTGNYDIPICHACHADLSTPSSVVRAHMPESGDPEPVYAKGVYKTGASDFVSARTVRLVHHDLLDGSDVCTACRTVMG